MRATPGAGHWSGVMRLGLGWATYRGPVGDNAPLALAVGNDTHEAPGIVVAADRRHRLRPGHGAAGLVYIEGESDLGRALGASIAHGVPGDVDLADRTYPVRYFAQLARPFRRGRGG